jgi:hypothetical protein
MFKNLLHNPMNVNDEELSCLNERRKKEKQLILDRDLDNASEKPLWFMISSEWLNQWKSFVSNKISSHLKVENKVENVRKSENSKIGILPPGPISNDDLFIKLVDGKEIQTVIREGLELNKDYRGVNREVWQIFHRMYGGGPIIVRDDLDIYARDLSKD